MDEEGRASLQCSVIGVIVGHTTACRGRAVVWVGEVGAGKLPGTFSLKLLFIECLLCANLWADSSAFPVLQELISCRKVAIASA